MANETLRRRENILGLSEKADCYETEGAARTSESARIGTPRFILRFEIALDRVELLLGDLAFGIARF